MLAEGALAAAAARARRGVLREHRRRGRRLGDEVRARGDRPAAAALLRLELPRRDARPAVARRRRVLQGGVRPAAARLRARPVRRPRSRSRPSCAPGRRRVHRRADPGTRGHAAAGRLSETARRSCAGATARCSSPTRSRPGSGAPASGSRSSTGGLEPDFVLVGKALSGGYMPVAAMVTHARDLPARGRDARALLRPPVDLRTQPAVDGGGARGAADDRARPAGRARGRHRRAAARRPRESSKPRTSWSKEVRGRGLMIGIELGAPSARVGAAQLAVDPSWRARGCSRSWS